MKGDKIMIKRTKYTDLLRDKENHFNPVKDKKDIIEDMDKVLGGYKLILQKQNIQFISSWILDKHLLLEVEQGKKNVIKEKLSRGRVVHVNPGAANLGREQRFIHPYIVLGEYEGTFIGVPITNMAKNSRRENYLRNIFEVELVPPNRKKKFTEFRCKKRSVADIRNIRGLDKRRIVQDNLYKTPRFAPDEYLDAISENINETIAQPSESKSK